MVPEPGLRIPERLEGLAKRKERRRFDHPPASVGILQLPSLLDLVPNKAASVPKTQKLQGCGFAARQQPKLHVAICGGRNHRGTQYNRISHDRQYNVQVKYIIPISISVPTPGASTSVAAFSVSNSFGRTDSPTRRYTSGCRPGDNTLGRRPDDKAWIAWNDRLLLPRQGGCEIRRSRTG